MAKLAAVTLFCLFAVSLPLTPPENDDSTTAVALPISDAVDTLIRLPTERVRADDSATATATDDTETSAALTEVTFQPINRHHFKVDPTMRQHQEIPYGDDMMVPSGENSDFEDPETIHGGGRRWVTLHHHHEDSDSDSDDDEDDKDRMVKRLFDYYRFDRKKLKALAKMKNFGPQKEEEDEQKNGGFMQRVRKFLGHYL